MRKIVADSLREYRNDTGKRIRSIKEEVERGKKLRDINIESSRSAPKHIQEYLREKANKDFEGLLAKTKDRIKEVHDSRTYILGSSKKSLNNYRNSLLKKDAVDKIIIELKPELNATEGGKSPGGSVSTPKTTVSNTIKKDGESFLARHGRKLALGGTALAVAGGYAYHRHKRNKSYSSDKKKDNQSRMNSMSIKL